MKIEVQSTVTDPRTTEIIARFERLPAPFLPILHGVQTAYGYLPEGPLRQMSEALSIPIAKLYGTISFYHYFRLEAQAEEQQRSICGGPACRLGALQDLLEILPGPPRQVSCVGRCDRPIPVLSGDRALSATIRDRRAELCDAQSPLPIETGLPECLFLNLRAGVSPSERGILELLGQVRSDPERALETLKQSGLTGRGGAGFPTGLKWELVRKRPEPVKYVVCNADEGEPGCFKDRVLMDHDPDAVVAGLLLAGLITGARVGLIYLRYEYPQTGRLLEDAIARAEQAGWFGSDFECHVRRGAGAYICGEETALLNSLEGERPCPRERPPYPTEQGLFGQPTAVNNVETLAAVPMILKRGADWYRGLGLGNNAGTKIFSVSGDILRPGNYELPLGTSLRDLLMRHAGGTPSGRPVKAVTMAGVSGGLLAGDDLELPLDGPSLSRAGSTLGAGGLIVYDQSRCMVRAAADCARFFSHESCGKCFPCRIGTVRITEILEELEQDRPRAEFQRELEDLSAVMVEASACGLGVAAPAIPRSLLRHWPDEVLAHAGGSCPTGECES